MFYEMKRIEVKEGNSSQITERYSKPGGLIEKQPGFTGVHVMVSHNRKTAAEKIAVITQWETEGFYKAWKKSPDHIAGHKARLGQPKPDFIVQTVHSTYQGIIAK
ncbi:antibiotic biosynthesis monooxygenase family protein [Peribacillus sp. SCS-37]|uniref:antibiotic biosynthesis monooxygenase family protein n=1 Tax=Paraperibacillus esterisolvens TaxID=3115296 RepID=UPI003905D95D